MSCGGTGRHRCDDIHRTVDDSAISARDLDFPIEPVDLVAGDLTDFGRPVDEGRYLMVLHRGGTMSFLTQSAPGVAPVVVDVLDGLGRRAAMRAPFRASASRSTRNLRRRRTRSSMPRRR
jgi:hypothetical protein